MNKIPGLLDLRLNDNVRLADSRLGKTPKATKNANVVIGKHISQYQPWSLVMPGDDWSSATQGAGGSQLVLATAYALWNCLGHLQ